MSDSVFAQQTVSRAQPLLNTIRIFILEPTLFQRWGTRPPLGWDSQHVCLKARGEVRNQSCTCAYKNGGKRRVQSLLATTAVTVLPASHRTETSWAEQQRSAHKYGRGRKRCRAHGEPSSPVRAQRPRSHTHTCMRSLTDRESQIRSLCAALGVSFVVHGMLVYVYFSNCFLLWTFQIKYTLVPNYYSRWLQLARWQTPASPGSPPPPPFWYCTPHKYNKPC